jgi:hypothetical protein
MNLEEITAIASKVRREFEQKKIPRNKLKGIYLSYNPSIEDINYFVSDAERLFPNLNCGLASVYLKFVLGFGEIVKGSYSGIGHTFLLIQDNNIIDVTADQFGGPKVYVGQLKDPWRIN